MPTIRTIARPPLSDSVIVRIPKEYQSQPLEIIIVPVTDEDTSRKNDFSNLADYLDWRGDDLSFQKTLRGEQSDRSSEKVPLFGALKDKIKYVAPDFDEPLEDFAEYM